jgi:hypothetical protein
MLNFNNYSGSKHYNLPIKPGLIGTAVTGFSMISLRNSNNNLNKMEKALNLIVT